MLQDGEGSGEKYDIDMVISQINVGIWESVSSFLFRVLVLFNDLIRWFQNVGEN